MAPADNFLNPETEKVGVEETEVEVVIVVR